MEINGHEMCHGVAEVVAALGRPDRVAHFSRTNAFREPTRVVGSSPFIRSMNPPETGGFSFPWLSTATGRTSTLGGGRRCIMSRVLRPETISTKRLILAPLDDTVARAVLAENVASRRALENAGFVLEREEGGVTWYALHRH
jgi:hypothetical protein